MALTDNLISYWKLDEASGDALDAHGSHTLTAANAPPSVAGKINTARSFGNATYFSKADHADLSVGDIDFTLAAWVKPGASGGNHGFLLKGDGDDLEYNLRCNTSDKFQFRVSSGTGFANLAAATSTNAFSVGTWYFIVAWHDAAGNTINIQVNNGTPDSTSYSAGSYDSAGLLYLGGDAPFTEYFDDGVLDEVAFWKRVLTSDERTALYNGGDGLAYPFTEGGGGGDSLLWLPRQQVVRPRSRWSAVPSGMTPPAFPG
jgi:hypothetical protein